MLEHNINQFLRIPFASEGLLAGRTDFTYTIFVDGYVSSDTLNFTEIGGGLYVAEMFPATTGNYALFIEGVLVSEFKVVLNTTQELLRDLQDQALGSWTWDKTTGQLILLRQDSTQLATFQVIDTLESASRERVV